MRGVSAQGPGLSGPQVFGWGFGSPSSVSADGTHVWVANQAGNSVTERTRSTGALVKVRKALKDHFSSPLGVSSDGTHVWVLNGADSVTGAERFDRSAGTGDLRVELRVQLPERGVLGRNARVGHQPGGWIFR